MKGRPRKEGRDGNAKKGNRRQKGIEERKEKMEDWEKEGIAKQKGSMKRRRGRGRIERVNRIRVRTRKERENRICIGSRAVRLRGGGWSERLHNKVRREE